MTKKSKRWLKMVLSGFLKIEVSGRINNLGFNVQYSITSSKANKVSRDSIVVVAQLSPEFTARLVDRLARA